MGAGDTILICSPALPSQAVPVNVLYYINFSKIDIDLNSLPKLYNWRSPLCDVDKGPIECNTLIVKRQIA